MNHWEIHENGAEIRQRRRDYIHFTELQNVCHENQLRQNLLDPMYPSKTYWNSGLLSKKKLNNHLNPVKHGKKVGTMFKPSECQPMDTEKDCGRPAV